MGVQIFPALQGYDKYYFLHSESLDWKSIPSVLENLGELARKIGVNSLGHFVNSTREEMQFDEESLEAFEQDSELIDGVYYFQGRAMWSIEPQWFEIAQGIETIQGLLDVLPHKQKELSEEEEENWADSLVGVRSELEGMAGILKRGGEEGRCFRLCVSG
jgi:hypothetical protein